MQIRLAEAISYRIREGLTGQFRHGACLTLRLLDMTARFETRPNERVFFLC